MASLLFLQAPSLYAESPQCRLIRRKFPVLGNLNRFAYSGNANELCRSDCKISKAGANSESHYQHAVFAGVRSSVKAPSLSFFEGQRTGAAAEINKSPLLSIAVIGATGELATRKIFPALFALFYRGYLPENIGIFGYSRKDLTDEDLRAIIASKLTCRIDHQENCEAKMDAFLKRTFHLDGGYNNKEGMSKLNAQMELIEPSTSGEFWS